MTFAFLLGCRGEGGSDLKEPKRSFTVKTSLPRVQPLNENDLRSLTSARNGSILFVNVWATWCAPCIEEFPDIVSLSKSYEGTNVEFVAISVDYPDEVESKIRPFIETQKVPFQVYVADFEHQESFINALNKSWNGAIPATFIYDALGRQRSFLVGKQTLDQFKQEIERVKTTS